MNNWGFANQKTIAAICVVSWGLIGSNWALAQDSGKELFQQRCAACHTVGEGRRVGPDLVGVNDRRSASWLLKFITASQSVIKSGDPTAIGLFKEYQIVMPDQSLSGEQIKVILDYIKEPGGGQEASAVTATAPEATDQEIAKGQDLFQGKIRFSGGGPSCISCHNVKNEAVFGGGILAKELTTVYSRVGEQGLRAILTNPPFPVMKAAFDGKPILDDETHALVGFLKLADKENAFHQPREYGWIMFGSGCVGVIALLSFYSFVGRRRKKYSVNQEIYDRQIRSE
ncbi:MAG: c-type cytochrome [Bdellovibrionales bacterium]|nr:c-type cytochrome [Bdellovibrionales bacterium]